MGWRAFTREGEELTEDVHGRPVQAGEEGKLACIAQEDFGHTVAVDLNNGIIALDYEALSFQNGVVELHNPRIYLWICEETSIVGEMMHLTHEFVWARDENGKRIRDPNTGEGLKVRNDILTPLTWRPIWFTRSIAGIPTKVIGAQTTLPEINGGRNVKKLISLFADGRIGID